MPVLGSSWDLAARWRECCRWTWHHSEHNNILEARASLSSLELLAKEEKIFDARVLLVTDSQGTLGAYSKGRSSVPVLNFLCRKVAAVALSQGLRAAWRYVPTDRNHADTPSRGRPFGMLPSGDRDFVRREAGAALPDFFYRRTHG